MNDANNQDDLKILDLDFGDLYQNAHIQLSLADLISKDDPNKPIIAAHSYGYNNIKCIPDTLIPQVEREDF